MRNSYLLALAVILAALSVNLAWAQANLTNNPNAVTIQGPDPTGQQGYPVATVPATGALPWPVAIQSFAASLCVTQCTSPWVVSGQNTPGDGAANPQDAVPSECFLMAWDGNHWERVRSREQNGNGVGPGVVAVSTGLFNIANLNYYPPFGADSFNDGDPNFSKYSGLAAITLRNRAGALERAATANGSADTAGVGLAGAGALSFDGALWRASRNPSTFKTVTVAAAGNTALWTPTAGTKFRLMRYMLTVTDQATQALAGTLSISLFDGAAGATGQVHDVFVPALGLVNSGSLYTSGWIDLGNGYLSTATNSVLNINLSAALTAGTVRVICCGTEE